MQTWPDVYRWRSKRESCTADAPPMDQPSFSGCLQAIARSREVGGARAAGASQAIGVSARGLRCSKRSGVRGHTGKPQAVTGGRPKEAAWVRQYGQCSVCADAGASTGLRSVCSIRRPCASSRTQVDLCVEQTSIQSRLLAAVWPRALSSATDSVGINAFNRMATMAIQLESVRQGWRVMDEVVRDWQMPS